MIHHSIDELIEQAKLNDRCPCKSNKPFGGCCGSLEYCDCKSGFIASDCCYKEESQKETKTKRA